MEEDILTMNREECVQWRASANTVMSLRGKISYHFSMATGGIHMVTKQIREFSTGSVSSAVGWAFLTKNHVSFENTGKCLDWLFVFSLVWFAFVLV
jgi:hypothetical protein